MGGLIQTIGSAFGVSGRGLRSDLFHYGEKRLGSLGEKLFTKVVELGQEEKRLGARALDWAGHNKGKAAGALVGLILAGVVAAFVAPPLIAAAAALLGVAAPTGVAALMIAAALGGFAGGAAGYTTQHWIDGGWNGLECLAAALMAMGLGTLGAGAGGALAPELAEALAPVASRLPLAAPEASAAAQFAAKAAVDATVKGGLEAHVKLADNAARNLAEGKPVTENVTDGVLATAASSAGLAVAGKALEQASAPARGWLLRGLRVNPRDEAIPLPVHEAAPEPPREGFVQALERGGTGDAHASAANDPAPPIPLPVHGNPSSPATPTPAGIENTPFGDAGDLPK